MTLRRTIFYFDPARFDFATPEGIALLAHELTHVCQWHQDGILRFVWGYLKQLRSTGYWEITYERDARAIEGMVLRLMSD